MENSIIITDKDTMIKLLYEEVMKLKDVVSKQHEHAPQENIKVPETPMYAIGTATSITKAIDYWIDDYEKHGGGINDRNIVGSQIVPDWGVRVRRRFAERGIKVSDGGNNNTTPIGKGVTHLTHSDDYYIHHIQIQVQTNRVDA